MASDTNFADRLIEGIERLDAPACVGLDPVIENLPDELRCDAANNESCAAAIEKFSIGVLDAVAGIVPAVKVQSACYERFGAAGYAAMERVCAHAKRLGLLVILDAKRGDIGVSARHYAHAAFATLGADALTVSPYLGMDTIEPMAPAAHPGKGLFVLVRTSNPGSDAIQNLRLASGQTVAQAMAAMVAELGGASVGRHGYSSVGAVVAATKPDDARAMREAMPKQIFLVPGFGAQGGTVDTVRELFDDQRRGALITASRSVIYAFDKSDKDWPRAIANSARQFTEELRGI
jgi:orotidine-5'-phosphate decarboxylase